MLLWRGRYLQRAKPTAIRPRRAATPPSRELTSVSLPKHYKEMFYNFSCSAMIMIVFVAVICY